MTEILLYNGDRIWIKDGLIHRDNDLPASINTCGDQEWWINGKRHRDNDLPAIVTITGDQEWFKNGKRHRDNDNPAVIYIANWRCLGKYRCWRINNNRNRILGYSDIN